MLPRDRPSASAMSWWLSPSTIGQPEQGPVTRFQRREFTRDAVVVLRVHLRLAPASQAVQPALLLLRSAPPVGHQIAGDAEHVSPQLFFTQGSDISLQ